MKNPTKIAQNSNWKKYILYLVSFQIEDCIAQICLGEMWEKKCNHGVLI